MQVNVLGHVSNLPLQLHISGNQTHLTISSESKGIRVSGAFGAAGAAVRAPGSGGLGSKRGSTAPAWVCILARLTCKLGDLEQVT